MHLVRTDLCEGSRNVSRHLSRTHLFEGSRHRQTDRRHLTPHWLFLIMKRDSLFYAFLTYAISMWILFPFYRFEWRIQTKRFSEFTDMCPPPHYRTFLDASIKQITNESFLYLRLREGLYLKSAILLITLQMWISRGSNRSRLIRLHTYSQSFFSLLFALREGKRSQYKSIHPTMDKEQTKLNFCFQSIRSLGSSKTLEN